MPDIVDFSLFENKYDRLKEHLADWLKGHLNRRAMGQLHYQS